MSRDIFDGGSRFPDFQDYDAFSRTSKRAPRGGPRVDASGTPIAAALPLTTDNVRLPANVTGTTPQFPADYTLLIDTQAELAWPRTINISSPIILPPSVPGLPPIGFSSAPFQARIEWLAGGGKGGIVFLTGSGGGLQFYVVAKSIRVDVGNWVNFPNPVSCSIQDSLFAQAQDLHYIDRSQVALAPGANLSFGIPPYGRTVQVRSNLLTQAANIVVTIQDNAFAGITQQQASDGPINVNCGVFINVLNNDPAPLATYALDYTLGYE